MFFLLRKVTVADFPMLSWIFFRCCGDPPIFYVKERSDLRLIFNRPFWNIPYTTPSPTSFWNCWLPELHPRNLTWNLKRSPLKRKLLLETIIFRFHVKFRRISWFFVGFFLQEWNISSTLSFHLACRHHVPHSIKIFERSTGAQKTNSHRNPFFLKDGPPLGRISA